MYKDVRRTQGIGDNDTVFFFLFNDCVCSYVNEEKEVCGIHVSNDLLYVVDVLEYWWFQHLYIYIKSPLLLCFNPSSLNPISHDFGSL